jgi:hypothetical protein
MPPVIVILDGQVRNNFPTATETLDFYDDMRTGIAMATNGFGPGTIQPNAPIRGRIRVVILRDTTTGEVTYWRPDEGQTGALNTDASLGQGVSGRTEITITQAGIGLLPIPLDEDARLITGQPTD